MYSPDLYDKAWDSLKDCEGIVVPGGFGNRGIEGKIAAIRYAREDKIPFLGKPFNAFSYLLLKFSYL